MMTPTQKEDPVAVSPELTDAELMPPPPSSRPSVAARLSSQFAPQGQQPQIPQELLALRYPLPRSIPPDFHHNFMGSSPVRPPPRLPQLPPQPPPFAIIQRVPPPPVLPEHVLPEKPQQVQPASSLHAKMETLALGPGRFGFRPIDRPDTTTTRARAVPPWTLYPRSWQDPEEPKFHDEQSRVD